MNIATILVSGVHARSSNFVIVPQGIVGASVTFDFEDPLWEGLSKTAVFQGNVTRDVIVKGNTAIIPAETVAKEGTTLKVGIYGVDHKNNLAIPTLWATIGKIGSAADPSGDPGAESDLPIWAQLADEVDKLKRTGSGGNANQGTGWTSEQIEILDSIGDHINFLDSEGGRLWDSLITALRSGQGSSAVLTSITAVYSGGSVEAGTLTRELKITVTATYDDGTSKTVTGYTTSPTTISEGENTITVTYNGKTSAFNVVGIVTPVEVVLESISAVFNGENAQAGTNASDLDITVTGHYSDGSTKTETGWTTAGVVSEGNNVFTIYLNDKTCTVTVVGVAVAEDVSTGAGTKIARFEGQASGSYGMAQINSSLIENYKVYAFVLDPSTTVSSYTRINLFGFVARDMTGELYCMSPAYDFSQNVCDVSEADGVITFGGDTTNRFHAGTFYDLYEIGTENQLITDGQLFDYIGTIEPTKNTGYENTLTIPAAALTDDSYFVAVLRSWNTEIDMLEYAGYGRTGQILWGYHNKKYDFIKTSESTSKGDITNKNDDGTWTIIGSSGLRFYPECNLVYDVYRANPTWG